MSQSLIPRAVVLASLAVLVITFLSFAALHLVLVSDSQLLGGMRERPVCLQTSSQGANACRQLGHCHLALCSLW